MFLASWESLGGKQADVTERGLWFERKRKIIERRKGQQRGKSS